MTEKRKITVDAALAEFLKGGYDEGRHTEIQQPLEVHLSDTTLYIPSATRSTIDKNHGKPLMAFFTKTDKASGKVYLIPAEDPDAKEARRLRSSDTMGPAWMAFGVPLRKLSLQLPDRKFIFPLREIHLSETLTAYEMSFAEFEHEKRNIDTDAIAAKKEVQAENAAARKAERIQRIKSRNVKNQEEAG